MDWSSRRRQIRAQVLSYRGRALLWAAATALLMAALMVLAFNRAAPVRVAMPADAPGPPPISVAKSAAVTGPAVTMHPISCPEEWTRPGVTCWQAR